MATPSARAIGSAAAGSKLIGAIRACRAASLGGHVLRCGDCDHATIAYNFCRNRHCPRCQDAVAKDWPAHRQVDLLLLAYYHLVFILPAPIAAISARASASPRCRTHGDQR